MKIREPALQRHDRRAGVLGAALLETVKLPAAHGAHRLGVAVKGALHGDLLAALPAQPVRGGALDVVAFAHVLVAAKKLADAGSHLELSLLPSRHLSAPSGVAL